MDPEGKQAWEDAIREANLPANSTEDSPSGLLVTVVVVVIGIIAIVMLYHWS